MTEGHHWCRMTQGDTTHRGVGDMLRPTTGFCHQMPTHTIQPQPTKRSPEGHEEGQPTSTVSGR